LYGPFPHQPTLAEVIKYAKKFGFKKHTISIPGLGRIPFLRRGPKRKLDPKPGRNAYAERVIGSIRRECLDHVVIVSERQLLRILSKYVDYYNKARTHLSLAKDAPDSRSVLPPSQGGVMQVPRVGGLHHEYLRRAA
jgi:Integrase core domain